MKEDNFKMPSPADLAKKDETVNISLRIKQSAVDIFNMLAEKEGTKPGTMMISLIEAYANNYRTQNDDRTLSVDVVKTYLSKYADKIGKLSGNDMILRVAQSEQLFEQIKDEMYGSIDNVGDLEYVLNLLRENKENEVDYSPLFTVGDESYYALMIFASNDKVDPEIVKEDHRKGDVYQDSLYLSPDKWLVTVLTFDKYEKKMNEVMPKCKVLLTEKMAHDIVDLANKEKDNEKYAKGLANILGKFVEEQSDE